MKYVLTVLMILGLTSSVMAQDFSGNDTIVLEKAKARESVTNYAVDTIVIHPFTESAEITYRPGYIKEGKFETIQNEPELKTVIMNKDAEMGMVVKVKDGKPVYKKDEEGKPTTSFEYEEGIAEPAKTDFTEFKSSVDSLGAEAAAKKHLQDNMSKILAENGQ